MARKWVMFEAVVLKKESGRAGTKFGQHVVFFKEEGTWDSVKLLASTEGKEWNILPDRPVDIDSDDEPDDIDDDADDDDDDDVAVEAVAPAPPPLSAAEAEAQEKTFGRFPPQSRGNMDQVPLVVVDSSGYTNERVGSGRADIRVPLQWADRQGTLNVFVGGDGRLYPFVLVFSGTSIHKLKKKKDGSPGTRVKHIREQMARARARGVHVMFQEKAWMDNAACNRYASEFLHQCLGRESGGCEEGEEDFLLVVDNLGGQGTASFKELARSTARTLVWMLPPNCTDLLQPVDSGIGKVIKELLKKKYQAYMHEMHALGVPNLQVATSASRDPAWVAARKAINCAKNRREMIIQWASEVYEEFKKPQYVAQIKKAYAKTGMDVSIDGSGWEGICPERMSSFLMADPAAPDA